MKWHQGKRSHSIGSISTGTLRPEDLFSAFLWECKHMKLSRADRNTVRRIDSDRVTDGETLEERLENDVEELQSILESNAMPGFYFGTHPGDGADFGYWMDESFVSEFDGLKVNDISEVPKGYRGEVLHVNDHGNVTLYWTAGRGLHEVWAVV